MGGKQDRQFLTVYYVCVTLVVSKIEKCFPAPPEVILLTDLQLNSIAYFDCAQSAVKGGAHMCYKDVHLHNAL